MAVDALHIWPRVGKQAQGQALGFLSPGQWPLGSWSIWGQASQCPTVPPSQLLQNSTGPGSGVPHVAAPPKVTQTVSRGPQTLEETRFLSFLPGRQAGGTEGVPSHVPTGSLGHDFLSPASQVRAVCARVKVSRTETLYLEAMRVPKIALSTSERPKETAWPQARILEPMIWAAGPVQILECVN